MHAEGIDFLGTIDEVRTGHRSVLGLLFRDIREAVGDDCDPVGFATEMQGTVAGVSVEIYIADVTDILVLGVGGHQRDDCHVGDRLRTISNESA